MLRRLISHPNRPGVHALIALVIVIVAIVILLLVAKSAGAADEIELTTGAKLQGQIVSRGHQDRDEKMAAEEESPITVTNN